MAENENPKITFDIDTKEAIEKILNLKGNINSLSSAEGLTGLLEKFKTFGIAAGLAAGAIYAFKKSFEFVEEAEQIKRVEHEFESLTESIGVAAEAFKTKLVGSAHGLVDDTELMQLANKAIVQMGDSAKRLPELFNLASKTMTVFGGDLKSNFEGLEHAIMSGSARALKQYGITLDTTRAIEQYAKAHGLAVSALTEAEKKQALMNAALDAGNKKYKDVTAAGESQATMWKQISVAASGIYEIFVKLFDKVFGPTISWFTRQVRDSMVSVKNGLTATFGDGAEKIRAQLEDTEISINKLKTRLKEINEGKGSAASKAGWAQSIENQLNTLEKRAEGLKEKLAESGETPEKKKEVDPEVTRQRLKQELAFNDQSLALAKQNADAKIALADSETEALGWQEQQRFLLREQNLNKLKELELSPEFSPQQKAEMRVLIEEDLQNKLRKLEEDTINIRLHALDQLSIKNRETADGIANAFAANSARAKISFKDMSVRGTETFKSIENNSAHAFSAIGKGLVSSTNEAGWAAKAMRNLFLGVLADRAEAEGKILLASSIWPPNPLGLAAGAGLLTLGGVLRGISGEGSSIGGGTSGGGGGASGTEGASAAQNQYNPAQQAQLQNQKQVAVNIHGNYLETDATRRQLMEMIRQETDATSFAYNQVGT